MQKGGKADANADSSLQRGHLGKLVFGANDILMLHASQESPLLTQKREREAAMAENSKRSGKFPRNLSSENLPLPTFTVGEKLEVLLSDTKTEVNVNEFAIPMRVVSGGGSSTAKPFERRFSQRSRLFCTAIQSGGDGEMRVPDAETILNGEDILWFAGDMMGMQTLRRIPGLVSQEDQVEKPSRAERSTIGPGGGCSDERARVSKCARHALSNAIRRRHHRRPTQRRAHSIAHRATSSSKPATCSFSTRPRVSCSITSRIQRLRSSRRSKTPRHRSLTSSFHPSALRW